MLRRLVVSLASMVVLFLGGGLAAPAGEPPDPQKSLEQRVKELEDQLDRLKKGMKTSPPATKGTPAAEKPAEPEKPPNLFAPLSERIEITGEVRVRGEYRDVTDYKSNDGMNGTSSFTLLRVRLAVDAKVNDWLRGYVQIQDSRTFGEESSTTADNSTSTLPAGKTHNTGVDLHQGYFDAKLNDFLAGLPLTLRAGRQEMQLGSSRLVDTCDWGNAGRSFDGARLTWKDGGWEANLFATNIHEPMTPPQGNSSLPRTTEPWRTDIDTTFSGLHLTCKAIENHTLDAYVYYREIADQSVTGGEDMPTKYGDREDFTYGARFLGKLGPADGGAVDYEGEAAMQTGRYAFDDESAWMAVGRAGYTFGDWPLKPRLGLEYDYASGDKDPTDGKHGNFDDLFGTRHSVLGIADYTGRSNLQDCVAQASVKPTEKWIVMAEYHYFLLAQEKDWWYASDLSHATASRDTTGDAGNQLGTEIDLQATYKLKNLDLSFGGAHFFAGQYVREVTGRERDANWLFLSATVKF